MSLVGNLEDLGLGDILQIVSLSRKSGILSLNSRNREGKIVFLNGQVIRASSSIFQENLGDLLLRRGLVDLDALKRALLLQKSSPDKPRIGTILAGKFGVPADTIEDVVKEQVEKIVYSFFGWSEGTFSFELGAPDELAATSLDPLQFMLDQGLNPQWLAMEGSRILDEKLHRGESLEEEAVESSVDIEELLQEGSSPEPAAVKIPSPEDAAEEFTEGDVGLDEALDAALPNTGGPEIIFVDDDEETRLRLEELLRKRGYSVSSCSGGAQFMKSVGDAVSSGGAPLLLVDLIMPKIDGSGVVGGVEVLGRLRREFPELTVAAMTDHPNQEAERRLQQLGIPAVIPKPRRNELDEPKGERTLEALVATLEPLFGAGGDDGQGEQGADSFDLRRELLEEIGEQQDVQSRRGPASPGLNLLKGMLQELNNPGLGGGIILLVLRFASELMNRAVIFLVKEDEVVGLGQFGIELTGEMADVRVRRMRIPRNKETVFDPVITDLMSAKVPLGSSEWDAYLRDQLGGGNPQEIFLGPLISEGRVVAILYGDNLPEKKPVGDTETLEIFLAQAGLAMERALWERRLRAREPDQK